jgi:hypothetical protein
LFDASDALNSWKQWVFVGSEPDSEWAPKNVTGTFAPASIAPPGNGTSTLTLKAASNASVATFTMTVSASGGGVLQTQTIRVTVR